MKRLFVFLVLTSLVSCTKKEEPASASTPTPTISNADDSDKTKLTHNQKAAVAKTLETKKPVKSLPLAVGSAGLQSLIPNEVDGMKKTPTPESTTGVGHAHAVFMEGKRTININVQVVKDSAEAKALRNERLVKADEVRKLDKAGLEIKGVDVDGTIVERIFYTSGSKKSEARARFADKLDVSLAVQPAVTPDESVKLFKTLDFKAFQAYTETLP